MDGRIIESTLAQSKPADRCSWQSVPNSGKATGKRLLQNAGSIDVRQVGALQKPNQGANTGPSPYVYQPGIRAKKTN